MECTVYDDNVILNHPITGIVNRVYKINKICIVCINVTFNIDIPKSSGAYMFYYNNKVSYLNQFVYNSNGNFISIHKNPYDANTTIVHFGTGSASTISVGTNFIDTFVCI